MHHGGIQDIPKFLLGLELACSATVCEYTGCLESPPCKCFSLLCVYTLSGMSDRLVQLQGRVEPELKARVKAEAERNGNSESGQVRDIVIAHYKGQSVEQVQDQLEGLTEEIRLLREVQRAPQDSGQVAALAREVQQLRGVVGELTVNLHHALMIFQAQRSISQEQLNDAKARFESLRAQFFRSP